MKKLLTILLVLISFTGCTAKLPAEVVTLSSSMEQQILSLQKSQITLIQSYFHMVRQQREVWIQTVWLQEYLKTFIKTGMLEETVKGQVVWDNHNKRFTPPKAPYQDVQKFDTLMVWTEQVQKQLAKKREELLAPLNIQEQELIAKVNSSYAQLLANNATITAHLVSIKDVEDVQSRLLNDAGLDRLTKISQLHLIKSQKNQTNSTRS
ncbi:hypothetical protein CSB62_12045 [Vibrio splendidus]|uniref:Uncharacterized protein n=1 Tax=Vibrio lentus TaxID=136468 RepID=A0A855IM80_9VIBR|nr:hypothetical protein [Vibrio lentus]PHN85627.1 hypothetical protein CSB62_12045 [Vibrio splendidus]MCB5362144.1 hypothetical protein [Vibrio lentus]MCB5452310.1 hypothetical protein [Vibrio lentus]MCB5464342.1 hypothetical protein [Vibrio lentus]MCC4795093.1 hypothetical protein [Vibrio lentus]